MSFRFPQVRLEVDFGNRSSIGELSLISVGYGLHQAWVYGSMFDSGSIFGIPGSVQGFFNESISLAYIVSILVYGILLLAAAGFDKAAVALIHRKGVLLGSAALCCVGTLILLLNARESSLGAYIELLSGILTGLGSTVLLLAWGVAFARRDISSIAINGAIAISVGFAVYAYILHALPFPLGGIVSGLLPFAEVGILLRLISSRMTTEANTPMGIGLPIDIGRFALVFGLPVLFLGFALGLMRQFSISTVLAGATQGDQTFLFVTACFATVFLLMVFLGVGQEMSYSEFFRPLIPFIAITIMFVPFAADSESSLAIGIQLLGYMVFEAMMWIFFGQLSQRFRISPVLVYGLGRGILSMAALGGSLLPLVGSDLVTNSLFGEGVIVLVLIVFMMFAFALLPNEKEIARLTTFDKRAEEAIRKIDATLSEEDGSYDEIDADADMLYVEMGDEIMGDQSDTVSPAEARRRARALEADSSVKGASAPSDGTVKPSDSSEPATSVTPSASDCERCPARVMGASSPTEANDEGEGVSALESDGDASSHGASDARKAMERHADESESAAVKEKRSGAFRQRCENIANTFLLSKREAEVMFYLARGFKSSNIQEILYISEGTAKTHIRHIYRKLDVHSQSELMKLVNSVEI